MPSPTRQPHARPAWVRPAAWVAAGAVLLLVFAAYRNPHTVLALASQVWACF